MTREEAAAKVRRVLADGDATNSLRIESNEVANYCFPKTWARDREQRARIIGDWLRAEVRFLA
jgi:hypothetical protein